MDLHTNDNLARIPPDIRRIIAPGLKKEFKFPADTHLIIAHGLEKEF